MRKLILASAAILAAFPALAGDLMLDTELGTTVDAAKAKLVEMGYDVRKSDMEDGMIEFYVVKDKMMAEIYVNPTTGKVVKISN